MKPETYNADDLGNLIHIQGKKPVYVYAANNYYKVKRVVDMGDFVIIETPSEDGVIALVDEE